jgi:hypothetical protein
MSFAWLVVTFTGAVIGGEADSHRVHWLGSLMALPVGLGLVMAGMTFTRGVVSIVGSLRRYPQIGQNDARRNRRMSGSPLPRAGTPGATTFYESARKHRARQRARTSNRSWPRALVPTAVAFILAGAVVAVRHGLFGRGFAAEVVAYVGSGLVLIWGITAWAIGLVRHRRRITDDSLAPALSVDQSGVTLHSVHARLDWAQIREIVIEQRPLPLPDSEALGQQLGTTIVFIPAGQAPGQVKALIRRHARRFRKLHGSPFAVDTWMLTTGSGAVTRAILEAAPCPVRHVTR